MIQAKLDALIRASAAHNRFIGVEDLTEDELESMRSCDEGNHAERIKRAQTAVEEAVAEAGERASEAAGAAKPKFT